MNKEEIKILVSTWDNIQLLILAIKKQPELLGLLMEVAMDDSEHENWRASWVADKVNDECPERIAPYLPAMVDFLQTTNNSSKKRQFLKLLSLHQVPEKEKGVLLDMCIGFFTSESEPIAVRVHAMQILYNITETEPGLCQELIQLIESEIELHPTAGIRSRGSRLLKKLYRMEQS